MQVKSLHQKQLQDAFLQNLSYEEWLMVNVQEPNDAELNAMEKVFCKATVVKNHKQPVNNLYFKPLQGA